MENRPAIRLVWWIGLVGALLLTLVILKQVALVLEALDDILRLAERTREAARGVATNVRPVSALPGLVPPVERLTRGASALAEGAVALERELASVGRPSGEA